MTKPKGFAAMSKRKRTEISKKGAAARKEKGGYRSAGRKGGEVTKALHGKDYYKRIGKTGGQKKKKK